MTETRNPIDETDRANFHEVGVPGATIGIGSMRLQEIEEGEREVGIIDEMIMRTAVVDGDCKEWWSLREKVSPVQSRCHEGHALLASKRAGGGL